jgi:hypothetical protein
MSGTRGGVGRIVAMGIGLAVALLLLLAGEARAGKYAVAQCGWYVGADADWADTTGGAKFRPDGYCVPPVGTDPFAGAHLKSLSREGQGTVSGTRFARWRWTAPAGTGITQVRGTWWHALHDGLEQRLGVGNWSGGFDVFAAAGATDVTPREFVAGFATPMPALEDRLLCAKAEGNWCALDPGSWSALRALTITVQDDAPPAAIVSGELVAGGWRRGTQSLGIWGGDLGAGVRYGETLIDGARAALTEFPCAKALIGGEWRATQMQPCSLNAPGAQSIVTTSFSDGPHSLLYCSVDFAANRNCAPQLPLQIDNTPPAHVRSPLLAGGEGWRRTNRFEASWANPEQAPGSPIDGAFWRLVGPNGYDGGVQFAPGRDRHELTPLSLPGAGAYSLFVWLRDEAGNSAPGTVVTVPLRLDDVRPGLAFAATEGENPQQLRAEVDDALSGPEDGAILYRRADSERWLELPTKLIPGEAPTRAHLAAPLPELPPGTYLFRADAVDAAGNSASTTLRADGTQMAVRRVAPAIAPRASTRLFARLRGSRGRGDRLTVPFAATALLSGHLTRADGAGIPARELQVASRPSRGAIGRATVASVRTGPGGGFRLELPGGPSRHLDVSFAGDGSLRPARHTALELRVRSGVLLRAAPRSLRTGQLLRLSGRVRGRGAPMPRRGKLVAIQYLEAATRRWRPVLVTRTGHEGRFRGRYRFRYVTGRARIRLRAVALPEERWPYAPGSSASVVVHVAGPAPGKR